MAQYERPTEALLPSTTAGAVSYALQRFLHIEALGGIVLAIATVLALIAANSPFAEGYQAFWNQHFSVKWDPLVLDYPLWYWVNDGLMAIFFFVIGLEIKRELVWGELRDWRAVVLPAVAAIGGALAPMLIFLSIAEGPGRDGWAVPMATDIAFVVGAMALLGPRVPTGLKIFMLSLAIIDDILAVLVIAVFFSAEINLAALGGAGAGLVVIAVLNRIGVRRVGIYVFVGFVIWLCTLKSGIHPTIAGVALGLLTPASAWIGEATIIEVFKKAIEAMRAEGHQREVAEDVAFAATESVSPLERLERSLHPWVSYAIMPIFALANAAIAVSLDVISHPTAIATMLGLLVGKPVGIILASFIAVKLGLGRLPEGTTWGALAGGGCLAGIGFTMALFIAALSVTGVDLEAAKTGVLAGSAMAIVLGMTMLRFTLKAPPRVP